MLGCAIEEAYKPVKGVVRVEPPRAKANSSESQSVIVRYSVSSVRTGRKISTRVLFSEATNNLPKFGCPFRKGLHPPDRLFRRVLHRKRVSRMLSSNERISLVLSLFQ